jgi:hypothetical protein
MRRAADIVDDQHLPRVAPKQSQGRTAQSPIGAMASASPREA